MLHNSNTNGMQTRMLHSFPLAERVQELMAGVRGRVEGTQDAQTGAWPGSSMDEHFP